MNDMVYVPIQPPDPIGDLLQYVGLHPRDIPTAAQAGEYMPKMEEFKTERDKELDERSRLSGMPRSYFEESPIGLKKTNVWQKEHKPSKGYYEPQKGEPLTTDDDLILDPTRGGTQMRWLKGT